jgi:hypothetical protein
MTSPETLELEAVDAALAGRYVAPEHAELAELALLLRDDRPEPSAAWATHLDRRVEAGFPARPRRRYVWLRKAAPALAIAACLLPVVAAAALIDGPGSNDAAEGGGGGATSGAGEAAGGMESQATEDAAIAPTPLSRGGDPDSDARGNRRQERSASLTIAVRRRDVDRAASRAGEVAADVGGFVQRSSVSSSGGGSLLLRVPSDQLDAAVQRLSRLGRVRDLSRSTVDITASVVSARERLTDARAERKALLAQLADAVTVNETESIRERLEIVSREIASARGALRRVNNRANFANIDLTLTASGAAEEDEGAWTPADAFDDALRVLEVAAGVLLIASAVLLPLALLWLLVWLARRGITRRQRERALDMA